MLGNPGSTRKKLRFYSGTGSGISMQPIAFSGLAGPGFRSAGQPDIRPAKARLLPGYLPGERRSERPAKPPNARQKPGFCLAFAGFRCQNGNVREKADSAQNDDSVGKITCILVKGSTHNFAVFCAPGSEAGKSVSGTADPGSTRAARHPPGQPDIPPAKSGLPGIAPTSIRPAKAGLLPGLGPRFLQ